MVGLTWHDAGYNSWCSVTKTPTNFQLRFNRPASVLYENFYDALDYNAKLLQSNWGHRPFYIALSGGMDSECMAQTLLRCQIPFTPVILKIENINDTESWYAEYFCRRNNINPIVIKLTLDDFYKQILKPYLPEINNTHIAGITINLFISDYIANLGGYYLNGTGDINYDFEQRKFFCDMVDFPIDVYRPGQHPSSFYMYTPEIALSYIYQFDMNQDEQYNKINFYNILPRPKIDYLTTLWTTSTKISNIINARIKSIGIAGPHWYGTKENVINALRPK